MTGVGGGGLSNFQLGLGGGTGFPLSTSTPSSPQDMIFLSTGAQILMFDPADIATPTVVMDAASGMTLYLFQPPNQFSLDGSKLYFVETDGTTTTVGYTTCSVRTDLFTTALTPGFATCGTAFKTSDDLTFYINTDDGSLVQTKKFDSSGTLLHTDPGAAQRLLHGSWLQSDHTAHLVDWKAGPDGVEFPTTGVYSNQADLDGIADQTTVHFQTTSPYSQFTIWPTAAFPAKNGHAIMPYSAVRTGHSEYELGKIEYNPDGTFIAKGIVTFGDASLTGYVARISGDGTKAYALAITTELASLWYSPHPYNYFAKLGDIAGVPTIQGAQFAVGDTRVCGFTVAVGDAGLARYPGRNDAPVWGPPLV